MEAPFWIVRMEVPLIAEVENWDRDAQRELFAVQELFRADGPEAFGLYADTFSQARSWDDLADDCSLEFFVQIRGRFLLLDMEILPGREIVLARARWQ